MQKTTSDGIVSSTVLARYIDLSRQSVVELANKGVLPHEKDSNGKYLRYDLEEAVRAYVHHLRDKPESKNGALSQRKLQAEVDFREAKAKKAQHDLDVYEGRLHRSEDVREAMEGLVYSVRAAVLALPGRLSMDLARMNDRNEVYQAIKGECHKVLEELSRHAYDPGFYEARVKSDMDEEE